MKYFVTGATGFIGSRVVRQLIDAGHEVAAVVRRPERARALEALGVRLFPGDITDRESLHPGMEGVDGVFHLAAWYKVGARVKLAADRINVEGTRHVLELARDLGVAKTVYTSTVAVFSDTEGRTADESTRHEGPWLNAYERTKWAAHYHVAEPLAREGLPLVIVLPGLVYGPGDPSEIGRAFDNYLAGKLPLLPRETAFCWAHVEDTARAHLLAMEKGRPGESYIIAGPPHTMIEAFGIAERITGVPAPRRRAGPALLRFWAAFMEPLEWFLPVPASYRSESLRTVAGVTYLADHAKARRELGFSPRPLEEGLRDFLPARKDGPLPPKPGA